MISGQKCSLEAKLVAVKFGNPTLLFFITMYKNEINARFFNVETYQQMWCVGLYNSVYVQWHLYYNCKCKFTKFDTKLNVKIPVEFRSKVFTGTGTGTKMLFRYRNQNSGRSMIGTLTV